MADEPAYVRKLREYAKGDLDSSHLTAFEDELFGASARATAILYSTLVENALVRLISKHMRIDLSSNDRRELFQTFDRKIALAYALKLIGPVSRADLDLVRFIRNQFAHSRRPLKFDIPEVADVCAVLKFPDLPGARVPIGRLDRAPAIIIAEEEAGSTAAFKALPKNRYVMACHNLAYRMIVLMDASPDTAATLFGEEPLP